MENKITIREAITEKDEAEFWKELYAYYIRDMFPNPDDEDREYFLGDEYKAVMQKIHSRGTDRCYYLFFSKNGEDIGFAMPVIYTSEDGKCFVMEYCIFPEHRGKGIGKECVKILMHWAEEEGALYFELNYGNDERRLRFWKSVGFIENGADEWGEPLMILPPKEESPFTVGIPDDPTDWQLLKLENGFKKEIGEPVLTEEQQEQLQQAIIDGKITFFIAKRGFRVVGMCSVAKYYSTFSCSDTGVYEDFYIEPAFRGKGIARKLAEAAQAWCRDNGISSLTVCCAACDEKMYQALGFDTELGKTIAQIL